MQKIYMVTGNPGKRKSAQAVIGNSEISIEMLNPEDYNIVEPQADSVEEIAISKAKQTFSYLKKPCIVEDSGFFIQGLNGFPGPYVKYMLETMGVKNIFNLSKTFLDKSCYFQGVLVYVDEAGVTHIFEEKNHGTLSSYMASAHVDQWSDLWRVFIPNDFDKPMADMTNKELSLYRNIREKNNGSRWKKLRQQILNE